MRILTDNKQEEILQKGTVQFITHQTRQYSYLDSARIALEGGCRWIQLRMKEATINEIRRVAIEVKRMCHEHDALFIIDDCVELVKELDAHGVHLGKNDMPIDEARRLLGCNSIIGGTANTFEEIEKLQACGADYIGCGPFRYTATKKNLSPLLGVEGYRTIVHKMKEAAITLPIVAIGGITEDDLATIREIGINGIALSGAVLQAEDPIEKMKRVICAMGSRP